MDIALKNVVIQLITVVLRLINCRKSTHSSYPRLWHLSGI